MDYTVDYPILAQEMPGGKRLIYLDSAATTQKPQEVLNVVSDYYVSMNGDVGANYHELGGFATEIARRSRSLFASFINAENSEIIFTHGATEALNLVAYGWALAHIEPGDEIVLPISEHHSNMLPWQMIAHARRAKLVFLNPCLDGTISDAEIEEKITKRTKIVAAAHVSHVFGTLFPLEKLAARAHEVGAITVFDCALSIAHRKVDIKELGADFAAFSSHKSYAPTGMGFLYVKKELLAQMEPLMYGDGMETLVGEWSSSFKHGFEKFEAGTYNMAGAAGFVSALRYLEAVEYEEIERLEQKLTKRFLEGIADNPRVKVYGNPEVTPERCGIVAFNYTGLVSTSVAKYLNTRGIAVGAGPMGSRLLMGYFGTSGMCRASFALYNTEEDVDALIDALAHARTDFAKQFIKP